MAMVVVVVVDLNAAGAVEGERKKARAEGRRSEQAITAATAAPVVVIGVVGSLLDFNELLIVIILFDLPPEQRGRGVLLLLVENCFSSSFYLVNDIRLAPTCCVVSVEGPHRQ